MHELSMVSAVVSNLEILAKKHQLTRIQEITLEIGKMRAVVPELLLEAFEQLAKDTPYEGATLHIEEIDVDLECRNCEKHIETEDSLLKGCPSCGSHRIRCLTGNELKIKTIAGE